MRGKSGLHANDLEQLASTKANGPAETFFPKEDLDRRMGSWILTQSPPRVIGNQVYWIRGNNQTTQVISTTAPTELGLSFQLSNLTDLVGLAGYFDQYCIYSVTCSINFNYTGLTPNALGTMYSAIDFDNVNTLGTAVAYQAYESLVTTKVTCSQSVQRLIHPAVSPALYGGSAFTSFGLGRFWIDSASTGVPHYGLRMFFISNTGSTLAVIVDTNYVVGFRNNL